MADAAETNVLRASLPRIADALEVLAGVATRPQDVFDRRPLLSLGNEAKAELEDAARHQAEGATAALNALANLFADGPYAGRVYTADEVVVIARAAAGWIPRLVGSRC